MDRKRDPFFLNNKRDEPKKENKLKVKNKKEFNVNKPDITNRDKTIEGKTENKFDENRSGLKKDVEKELKKPFDKKIYRLKKYSKKYKLEQWEDQRKKHLLRTYYKDIQNEPLATGSYKPVTFDEDHIDGNQEVGRFVKHPDVIEKENLLKADKQPVKTKKDPFWKAKEQFNKIKQDKLLKKQEIEKIKGEKQQKLQEYKKKKQERFKKLSKKTRKGQPVMTGRLELLLEKIQKG